MILTVHLSHNIDLRYHRVNPFRKNKQTVVHVRRMFYETPRQRQDSGGRSERYLMYLRLWRGPHQGPLRGPSAECWHIIRVKTLWGSSYSGSAHREQLANQQHTFLPELRPLNHLLQLETGQRCCSGRVCPMAGVIVLVLFFLRKLLANHK